MVVYLRVVDFGWVRVWVLLILVSVFVSGMLWLWFGGFGLILCVCLFVGGLIIGCFEGLLFWYCVCGWWFVAWVLLL